MSVWQAHDSSSPWDNSVPTNANILSRPAFVRLRDLAMGAARAGWLRKLAGHVWRPVAGCPCAYVQAESFRDYLNKVLGSEPMYHINPAYQRQLLKYLNNHDPDDMHDIVFDRAMLSFADGVLIAGAGTDGGTNTHSGDGLWALFVPYMSLDGFEMATEGRVARHHIALPYAPRAFGGGALLSCWARRIPFFGAAGR